MVCVCVGVFLGGGGPLCVSSEKKAASEPPADPADKKRFLRRNGPALIKDVISVALAGRRSHRCLHL